jgi:hypothetical protein
VLGCTRKRREQAILQTYSWSIKIADKDPDAVITAMRELAARLIRIRPVLRGLKLEKLAHARIYIQMRVAGHSRWEIQRDARKLIVMFLRRALILTTALELEQVVTEKNGRELYLGEGRTPMTKPPRAARQADGTPWDHYEWWGDDLPSLPTPEGNPQTDWPAPAE